jgi:hypothetical protein
LEAAVGRGESRGDLDSHYRLIRRNREDPTAEIDDELRFHLEQRIRLERVRSQCVTLLSQPSTPPSEGVCG